MKNSYTNWRGEEPRRTRGGDRKGKRDDVNLHIKCARGWRTHVPVSSNRRWCEDVKRQTSVWRSPQATPANTTKGYSSKGQRSHTAQPEVGRVRSLQNRKWGSKKVQLAFGGRGLKT